MASTRESDTSQPLHIMHPRLPNVGGEPEFVPQLDDLIHVVELSNVGLSPLAHHDLIELRPLTPVIEIPDSARAAPRHVPGQLDDARCLNDSGLVEVVGKRDGTRPTVSPLPL